VIKSSITSTVNTGGELQGVLRLVDITAGVDFLGLWDKKFI